MTTTWLREPIPGSACSIIAEVSQTHDGSLGTAHAFIDAAAEAGCRWVAFHAPPRFRHWPLLRAMGFAEREGRRYMFVDIPSVTGTGDLDHWQLVPGDADAD
ncbi:MAG: hypothetical protein IIA30_15030 [Myxococcales bacterium]|nr:hypothetical protein [Myxococcales bacterium]